jgi:hypothetical protein
MRDDHPTAKDTPWLLLAAGGASALVGMMMLSMVGWERITVPGGPDINVNVTAVSQEPGGFAVGLRVINNAASDATVDSGGNRLGTVVLGVDPGPTGPELRVRGYRAP